MQRTDEMILADAEIEREFCMTLDEIAESKARDTEALDGQLDFRDLKRQQYNRAYNRRYYSRNKAALLARNKQYREEHKEQVEQKHAEWIKKNAGYLESYQKAYYAENQDTICVKKMLSYEVDKAYRQIMEGL